MTNTNSNSNTTTSDLGRTAASLYSDASLGLRFLARHRPSICPFDRLIDLVPEGSRVLDIGCGSGLFLGLLAARGRISSGVGFDPFEPAIDAARGMARRSGENVRSSAVLRFEKIGATEPWPEGPFDIVSMIDVMHHLPREIRERCIKLASDRLKPGGLFLYKDMCLRPLWRCAMNRLHDLVLTRQLIKEEPVEHVEQWARDRGLECSVSERINMLWYGHDLRVFEKAGRVA